MLMLLFSAVSCEKLFFEPEPGTDPVALFEQFWGTFNTDYAPFEERGVDWDEVYAIYRPMVNDQTNEEELHSIFKEMLSGLNDSHVKLTVPGKQIYTPNLYYQTHLEDGLFDRELVKSKYLAGEAVEYADGWVVSGRMDEVGYVYFRGVGSGLLELGGILEGFNDVSGLIIDLRHNGGGNMIYAFSELGRFTDEVRLHHRSRTKNGPGRDDYDEWFDWKLYPSGEYFDKPLVLLTDRYTVSAAERATMALKTIPNLVHMGDTTNGGISTMIGRELPNGWYFTVCPQQIQFVDGKSYEGIGLIPDVVVENTFAEMAAGTDKQLETALSYLRNLK